MKKYLTFMQIIIKEEFNNFVDLLGSLMSFTIHITVFSFLWDFVLENKTMSGYTKKELIWYVIIAETILYSFHYYYRKIANKIENGDFAYEMTKPYNFFVRIIVEGIAELPITLIILVIGTLLGIIYAGSLDFTFIQIIMSFVIIMLASILLLIINVILGSASIWLGRDVSSLWLLVQKAMLIFAFTPIELFNPTVQKVLLILPTTHVIYTPSSLFVHFSKEKLIISVIYILASLLILTLLLCIIYRKGVKKQNVQGI